MKENEIQIGCCAGSMRESRLTTTTITVLHMFFFLVCKLHAYLRRIRNSSVSKQGSQKKTRCRMPERSTRRGKHAHSQEEEGVAAVAIRIGDHPTRPRKYHTILLKRISITFRRAKGGMVVILFLRSRWTFFCLPAPRPRPRPLKKT